MSATLKATKKRMIGKKSKRNFKRADSTSMYRPSALLPASDRLAGGLVARPDHQAARRDLHRVERALGHRHVGSAAVERIRERQVVVVAPRQRPEIHGRGLAQVVHRAPCGSFLADRRVAAREALQ